MMWLWTWMQKYGVSCHIEKPRDLADDCQGDLGHTDLQEDLEFHPSSQSMGPGSAFNTYTRTDFEDNQSRSKIPPDQTSFLPGGAPSSSGSSKRFLWTISFYAQFFDVDTNEVIRRCTAAIFPRANFLDVLDGNPDLYGPFWIATTVVMILFLTGTISQYLAHTGRDHFAYDFKLLSGWLDCTPFILNCVAEYCYRCCRIDLWIHWYGRRAFERSLANVTQASFRSPYGRP